MLNILQIIKAKEEELSHPVSQLQSHRAQGSGRRTTTLHELMIAEKNEKPNKPKRSQTMSDLKKERLKLKILNATKNTLFGKMVHPDDYNDFHESLKIFPCDRTEQNIEILKIIIADLKSMQCVPASNFDEICRNIVHRFVPKGEKVIKKGNIADEAYILMSGTVDIVMENSLTLQQCLPGDFFGDYGLQRDKFERTADCIASKDVDVAAIPRHTFIKCMLDHMHSNKDLKTRFFAKHISFSLYLHNAERYDRAMDWMVARQYRKGEVIGLQGHSSKKVCFVVDGAVRVLRTVSIQGQVKVIDLGIYRKGQAFGVRYVDVNESNYHSWIALTNVVLYEINRADFLRIFGNEIVQNYKESSNVCYCSDAQLRVMLKNRKEWNAYKKELIEFAVAGGDTSLVPIPKYFGYFQKSAENDIVVSSAIRTNDIGRFCKKKRNFDESLIL